MSEWWHALAHSSIDVIYDTVGQPGTGDRAMPFLKSGGFYVTITGQLPAAARQDVHSNTFINSDTNLDNLDLLEKLRHLVESDQLRMHRLTTYPLSKIIHAFEQSATGHVNGKLVIEMPPRQALENL